MIGDGAYEIANHKIVVTTCAQENSDEDIALLYWIMMEAHRDRADTMAASIAKDTDRPFRLIACNVNDWDHELSPWPAANITGQDDFTGEAPGFLSWLLWDCIPFVEGWAQPRDPIDRTSHDLEGMPQTSGPRLIGGYSMAGLFACWAFLTNRAFRGVVSASGSLWYPEWLPWAAARPMPAESITYLSLGTKEPRVKNPIVATVGEMTEQTAALFEADRAGAHTFVWNPGGHFNEPSERMAAGFAWALNHGPCADERSPR